MMISLIKKSMDSKIKSQKKKTNIYRAIITKNLQDILNQEINFLTL